MSELTLQDKKVREAKEVKGKLLERQRFDALTLRQTAELTIETVGLTLKKYSMALIADEVFAKSFKFTTGYNEDFEAFKQARGDSKPLAEFIGKLKRPAFFILSIKWAAEGSTESGAHVWAGALTDSGFRIFDPNMGTFFTNTDIPDLIQVMFEKWSKEDRPINACVYLPVGLL
jgi:hypothetical protein